MTVKKTFIVHPNRKIFRQAKKLMKRITQSIVQKNFLLGFISALFVILWAYADVSTGDKDGDYSYKKLPEKPTILVNLHVGKTGGSTMNEILERHYRKEIGESVNCILQPGQHYPLMSIRKLRENFYTRLSLLGKAQACLTGGHIGLEVLNFFPKGTNVKAFAIVREPKSLLLSHFWYALQGGQELEINVVTLDQSLIDFIVTSAQYNNDNVRWFSRNNKLYDNKVPITEEDFQEIKNNIERDFLFVGLSHKFDETLIALRRLMGWKFDENLFYKTKNKTAFKMPEESYPDSILDQVKERFAFDKRLYAWLEKRFDSLTKLLGADFEEEVRVFKRLNYLYQAGNPRFEMELQHVQRHYKWARDPVLPNRDSARKIGD
jgi:hypothetical protein